MDSEGLNLWTSLLRESTKKSNIPESTCIIVGNTDSGKKSFLESMCKFQENKDSRLGRKDIMSYNYFDVEEGELDGAARVNVWSFDHHMFANAFEIVKNSNTSDKLLFMVVLNLSKPDECISSLSKWLVEVSMYIKQYHKILSPEASKLQKYVELSYLKSARSNKGSVCKVLTVDDLVSQDTTCPADEGFDFIADKFSVPIVVVGSKCDLVVSNDGLAIKRARELQGQLRQMCLEIGAALVYTSTTNKTNCNELKKYVAHRLYPESIPAELGIEDKLDCTFIPAGFDSAELVQIASGLASPPHSCRSRFEQDCLHFSDEARDSGHSTLSGVASDETDTAALEPESEQDWLSGLHGFIQQLTASGGSSAPSISRPLPEIPHSAANTSAAATSNSAAEAPIPANGAIDSAHNNAAAPGGSAPVASRVLPRKGSTVRPPAAAGENSKDVGDFFKNLLVKK